MGHIIMVQPCTSSQYCKFASWNFEVIHCHNISFYLDHAMHLVKESAHHELMSATLESDNATMLQDITYYSCQRQLKASGDKGIHV